MSSPQSKYESRRDELRAQAALLNRRSSSISLLRGLTFLIAIGCVIGAWSAFLPSLFFYVAALSGCLFIGLVVTHAVLITREDSIQKRLNWNLAALDRMAGKPLPDSAKIRPAPENHPYAKDLDVFGKASIFSRLDTTQTAPGESTLTAWLAEPAPPAEIAGRQEAVRELAALFQFREDLAFEGLAENTKGKDVRGLIEWAEKTNVFTPQLPSKDEKPIQSNSNGGSNTKITKIRLARIAMIFVPITIVLFAASQLIDWHSLPLSKPIILALRSSWLLSLLIQLLLYAPLRPAVEPLLSTAASEQARFGRFHGHFARIEQGADHHAFAAPKLLSLQKNVAGSSGADASKAMQKLSSIVEYAALRNNGFVHLFANTLLLWDLFCARALEQWRVRSGSHVRAWFEALGELEALSALATYSFEEPACCFPEVTDGPPRFEAKALAHPLIAREKRIANDVTLAARKDSEGARAEHLGPKGAALLITGSNMSGKSTLMRSMGVAAVMAQAGAPVCAERLSMTPLCVRTSMRIDDSLERGVSHFYAEVERLCAIVNDVNAGRRVFFLLDEILHGTNSRERHIGAAAVVMHMIEQGAIGSVSSHDLALADMALKSHGRIRNVHFEESIQEGKMAFDYKLKEGVVTTTNALRLMRLVGLNLPALAEPAE